MRGAAECHFDPEILDLFLVMAEDLTAVRLG